MFVINPYSFAATGLPAVPAAANLRYRFDASSGVYSDAGGSVPCVAGEGVQVWNNFGLASDDGVQSTSARRPIYRTGGIGGRPYLECRQATQQYFNDLAEGSQPIGISAFNPYTVVAVVRQTGLANSTIFGSPDGTVRKCTVQLFDNAGSLAVKWSKNALFANLPDQASGINIIAVNKEISGTGNFGLADNDSNYAQVAQLTNASSTATTGMGFFRHGASTDCADFDIYELYYYDTQVSSTDINTLMNTLRTRYGLPTV